MVGKNSFPFGKKYVRSGVSGWDGMGGVEKPKNMGGDLTRK